MSDYFLQIYNEQITDLLDPNQGNLQVNKIFFKELVLYLRIVIDLDFYHFFCHRLEKMLNQGSMLKILQKSVYVQWRM